MVAVTGIINNTPRWNLARQRPHSLSHTVSNDAFTRPAPAWSNLPMLLHDADPGRPALRS